MSLADDLSSAYGRRAAAAARPGCYLIRKARETRTAVGLYHAGEAGLESDPEALAAAPWATVCEVHGILVCHAAKRQAISWLAEPSGWCELCRAAVGAGRAEP